MEVSMEVDWNDHKVKITGNWTGRWLYLAPDYELWVDEQKVDRAGGPRLSPKLEAIVEDDEGALHHIEADVLSIIGWKPRVDISIGGEHVASGRIIVENLLNPFLVLFILLATAVMLYVGPDVLRTVFE
jgi:hypothetical protein